MSKPLGDLDAAHQAIGDARKVALEKFKARWGDAAYTYLGKPSQYPEYTFRGPNPKRYVVTLTSKESLRILIMIPFVTEESECNKLRFTRVVVSGFREIRSPSSRGIRSMSSQNIVDLVGLADRASSWFLSAQQQQSCYQMRSSVGLILVATMLPQCPDLVLSERSTQSTESSRWACSGESSLGLHEPTDMESGSTPWHERGPRATTILDLDRRCREDRGACCFCGNMIKHGETLEARANAVSDHARNRITVTDDGKGTTTLL